MYGWDDIVFTHLDQHGMICTGETYKDKVKMTFAKGPHLRSVRPLQLEPRCRGGWIRVDRSGILSALNPEEKL